MLLTRIVSGNAPSLFQNSPGCPRSRLVDVLAKNEIHTVYTLNENEKQLPLYSVGSVASNNVQRRFVGNALMLFVCWTLSTLHIVHSA